MATKIQSAQEQRDAGMLVVNFMAVLGKAMAAMEGWRTRLARGG